GVLVQQSSGERFEISLHAPQATGVDKKLNVIADPWKAVGLQVNFNVVPPAQYSDLEYRAKTTGAGQNTFISEGFFGGRNYLHSRLIASAANRWTGANRSGYANPNVDALLDKLSVTLDDAQRIPLHRELLTEAMGDVPF